MNRRSFLKNSIGALLFGAIGGNKVLNAIVDVTKVSSHDILLYYIETKDGSKKIHGTKWVDIATSKISPFKFNLETFKPIGVFPSNTAYDKKKELWKEYKCDGALTYVNYDYAVKRGNEAAKTGQLKSICSKGGKVGGAKNRDNKHGLFSFDSKQMSEFCSLGGHKAKDKMLQWCKDNNHWVNLGLKQRGVPKKESTKKKISEKLKGRKLPKETCEKMSKSRMGRKFELTTIYKFKNSAKKRRNAPQIIQCDINGKEIKLWDGLAEIYDYYNSTLKVSKSSIRNVCLNWQNNTKGSLQHKGFVWKYKNN